MKKEKKYLELNEIPNAKIEDLTGLKFEKLKVVKFDIDRYLNEICKGKQIKHYWICECKCGNKTSTGRYSLTSGKTTMCKQCSVEVGSEKVRKSAKYKYTFEQWCKDNAHQDYLYLWDYELNDCNPNEITSKCNRKYYFKCSRGLHDSKSVCICKLSDGRELFCNKCNSFGQYLLDMYGKDGIERYWSNKNTVDPFEIRKKTDRLIG